jgi:hypothetical protein
MKRILVILLLAIVSSISKSNGVGIFYELNEGISYKDVSPSAIINNTEIFQSDSKFDIIVELDYSVDGTSILENKLINEDNADIYLKELRDNSKTIHTTLNKKFVKKLEKYEGIDVVIDQYSPFITLDFSTIDIKNLYKISTKISKLDGVKNIFIKEEPVSESIDYKIQDAIEDHNIDYLHTNYPSYKGNGINVGVLEPSIMDHTDHNFINSLHDPIVRNISSYDETVHYHTTAVASIIGGMYGVAPDVQLLSVELYIGNGYSGEIGWLLDNGVHVINMSYGDQTICSYGGESPESSTSAYLNYLVRVNKVSMVAATGNELSFDSGGYVCSPANAANIISVGSVDTDFRPSVFSNYKMRSSGLKGNPTVVAVGEEITLDLDAFPSPITISGTSLSTPIVTGTVALMMDKNYLYKYHPEMVIAALVAGSDHSMINSPTSVYVFDDNLYNNSYDDLVTAADNGLIPGQFDIKTFNNTHDSYTNLYARTGAGMINGEKLFESGSAWYKNNYSGLSGYVQEVWFSVDDNDLMTVSFAVLVGGSTSSVYDHTRYRLELWDNYGNKVDEANSGMSNIFRVEYRAEYTGYYIFRVYQIDTDIVTKPDYTGYAIYIE